MRKMKILAITLLIFSSQSNVIAWGGKIFFKDKKLRTAVRRGDVTKVKLLLEDGANPDQVDKKSGDTLLMIAMRNAFITIPITPGPDVHIIIADRKKFEKQSLDIVRLLLNNGATNVNQFNKNKYTLLMLAYNVYKYRYQEVQTAQKLGILPPGGRIGPAVEVIQLIVNKGADINGIDVNSNYARRSPFLMAIYHGDIGFVQFFIDKDADVNQPDSRGKTPLFNAKAMRNPNQKIIDLLIDADATE